MAHTSYTWSTGDTINAATVGTKGMNNLEAQYSQAVTDFGLNQAVGSGSSPSFAGLTLTGALTSNSVTPIDASGNLVVGAAKNLIANSLNIIEGNTGYNREPKNVMFRAYTGASQSFPSNAATKVTFSGKTWDPNSVFDAVTNYHFNAPVNGYYLLTARIAFVPASTPTASWSPQFLMSKNESYLTTIGWDQCFIQTSLAGQYLSMKIVTIAYLLSTDNVECYVYQPAAATCSLNITTTTDLGENNFEAHLLAKN